eukprot:9363402-Alexandrium_andersonii.AAC.1
MSASLVGSEMCIRDRDADRAAARRCRSPVGPQAYSAGELVTGSAQEDAVSYTHLTLPTICSV